jgi:hypothetical protein
MKGVVLVVAVEALTGVDLVEVEEVGAAVLVVSMAVGSDVRENILNYFHE